MVKYQHDGVCPESCTENTQGVQGQMGEHKKEAKKVYSLGRKEQRQTGGGPEIKLVTPAINRTIDLCRDSAAFNGIGGFQTSVNGNLCSFIHQFKLIPFRF